MAKKKKPIIKVHFESRLSVKQLFKLYPRTLIGEDNGKSFRVIVKEKIIIVYITQGRKKWREYYDYSGRYDGELDGHKEGF